MNNNESPRPQNFRSALGGYNKEDVNRFIKETDLANSAKEQEFAAKLSALEEERDALNAAKAALEEELKAARELNDANEKKLAEQSAELEKKTAEILSQNTEIKDLQKHIGIYKDQADAQNVMIENLKKEAAEAKDKLSEADAQLDNAKASLAELEEIKASLDEYKQKFVQAEAECADLRQQCAEAEEALHCFRTELENAVQQEKERAEREINTMRESIAAENETLPTSSKCTTKSAHRSATSSSTPIGMRMTFLLRPKKMLKKSAQTQQSKRKPFGTTPMQK